MKVIVTSLMESFTGIINVFIVIILCWVMLGILGVNLLGNLMGYCSSMIYYYDVNITECIR